MARPRGSRTRALLVGVGALCLFGGWALIANRAHGGAAMARAGAAQGVMSFVSSTSSVLLLEYLHGLGRSPRQRFMLAAFGTPAIILAVMTGGHVLAGTPNIVATLLPSWLSGAVFCLVYTWNLGRLIARTPAP